MAYILIFAFLLLLPLTAAKAVCPICTVAICAGVGFSRWLGVDDSITGLWIGGLTVSLTVWTIVWLDKKNIRFMGRKPLVAVLFYILTIWPLYQFKMAGIPANTLWGMDKLIFGIILGTIGFIAAIFIESYLRKKNHGQAYFPFQKVILPVSLLAILSLALYLACTFKLLQ